MKDLAKKIKNETQSHVLIAKRSTEQLLSELERLSTLRVQAEAANYERYAQIHRVRNAALAAGRITDPSLPQYRTYHDYVVSVQLCEALDERTRLLRAELQRRRTLKSPKTPR